MPIKYAFTQSCREDSLFLLSIAHIDSLLSNTCLIDCIPEQNYLVFEKITQKNF